MFKKYQILLAIALLADSSILYSSDKKTATTVYCPIELRANNYEGGMSPADIRTDGLIVEEYMRMHSDIFEGFVPSLILNERRKLLIEQRSKEGETLIARKEGKIRVVFPEGTPSKTVRQLINKIAIIPDGVTLVLLPYKLIEK